MNAAARHGFWSAPRTGYSVLRTQPMLSGGRPIGLSGPFMGATVSVGLDSLSVAAIQNRVLATRLVQRYQAELSQLQERHSFRGAGPVVPPWDRILAMRPPTVPQLTPAERDMIQALSVDTPSEILDELSLIDGFFGVVPGPDQYRVEWPLTRSLCEVANGNGQGGWMGRGTQQMTLAQAIYTWASFAPSGRRFWGAQDEDTPKDDLEAVRSNPFYCGTPASFPEVVYGLPKEDYAGWFGIDPNLPWGQVKTQVQNAITVMNVVGSYPFPPPLDLEKDAAFWILSIGEIREIVHTPEPVDPEVVRYWITMTVLANYTAWVDKIEQDAKKKAKKARRKMIMTMVALAVASIAAAFLLPAVIAVTVSAIKTAVTTYTDAQKRRKAARDMADAAKMFEADAPAFAKEVDHAAQLLDERAAQDQAAAPPSPELQAAIQEVKDDTGPGLGTILPVAGGTIAAGIAAFFIFK